jgi:hypothetical protein
MFAVIYMFAGMFFGVAYIWNEEDMEGNDLALFVRHTIVAWPLYIMVIIGVKLIEFLRYKLDEGDGDE